MKKILVSGLVNMENTCYVSEFPVAYQPIDYNFFGIKNNIGGVGYNVAMATKKLGCEVDLASFLGEDLAGSSALMELEKNQIRSRFIKSTLKETPMSTVLYDKDGKRRVYCDLKDIQDRTYDFDNIDVSSYDMIAACNINFSRDLLVKAKREQKMISTDVHVLTDLEDSYNKDFCSNADILFLSDEGIKGNERGFMEQLEAYFKNKIIVLGRGSKGALMYLKEEDRFVEMPAMKPEKIVNTVGAGDALFSAFITMYVNGYKPEECLHYAQKFAAIKIGYDGAAVGFCDMETLLKS